MIRHSIILSLTLFSSSHLFAHSYTPCHQDQTRLIDRQKKLQDLKTEDQKDRLPPPTSAEEWVPVQERDLQRRKRVGEIFGEGCFKDAADFAAGALIYQHGDTPEHFWQAFMWSMRAVALGDLTQKSMAANGIDRYLVQPSIGQKQLFASQASKPLNSNCWCLRQVERSFPDAIRVEYKGKTYKEALDWIHELNVQSGHPSCPVAECDNTFETLKPTPRGSVPGLW